MKNGRWMSRGICLLLVAMLLLIFCSAGHDCHGAMEHTCSVCLVLSAWKLALPGLLALAGLVCLVGEAFHTADGAFAHSGEKTTLVALKVKLSD